jgi:hypothetical protein
MKLVSDFGGPHGSLRFVATGTTGQDVYENREASAIQILLARKISPDVVLTALRASQD